MDPVGKKIVDVSPDPNTGTPGQIDNNFVSVPITRNRTDQFDVRVDHNLSSQFNLFGRYSFSDTNLFQPSFRPGLSEGSRNDTFGSALWRSQAVAVGGTWVLVVDAGFGNALRIRARELLPDTTELRLRVPGTAHRPEGRADG